MPWYEWTQNNSGGEFDVDDSRCHRLFIESSSLSEAESKAFYLGVYYDGVDEGRDCSCCGDRWYPTDGEVDHSSKGSIEDYAQHLADNYGWTSPDARLFYANGNVTEIFIHKKGKN